MKVIIEELDKCEEFEKDYLSSLIRKIAQQQNIKFHLLMKSLRTSLSGIKVIINIFTSIFKILYLYLNIRKVLVYLK